MFHKMPLSEMTVFCFYETTACSENCDSYTKAPYSDRRCYGSIRSAELLMGSLI
jgi:hypothetical protein